MYRQAINVYSIHAERSHIGILILFNKHQAQTRYRIVVKYRIHEGFKLPIKGASD